MKKKKEENPTQALAGEKGRRALAFDSQNKSAYSTETPRRGGGAAMCIVSEKTKQPSDIKSAPHGLSGLRAKAIRSLRPDAPRVGDVMKAIPRECLVKDTATSLAYMAMSLSLTLGLGILAYMTLPRSLVAAPVWLAYAIVEGTIATGLWVVAHEVRESTTTAAARL